MKRETLIKATEIVETIEKMQKHLEEIEARQNHQNKKELFFSRESGQNVRLISQFLIVPMDKLMEIYIFNIKAKIVDYEKQLDNLQDL